MPGSSELSDALNPYFFQSKQPFPTNQHPNSSSNDDRRPIYADSTTNYAQYVSPPTEPAQYVPHRSELENAINPDVATQALPPQQPPTVRPRRTMDSIGFMKGLLVTISSLKEASETEKRERLAWEQAHALREAQLERRLEEMQQEIDDLREQLGQLRVTSLSAMDVDPVQEDENTFLPSTDTTERSEFVEGSSTSGIQAHCGPTSESFVGLNAPTSEENMKVPFKSDRRPKSLQAAMRAHILRMMDVDHDQLLPLSIVKNDDDDDVSFDEETPVRFVWNRTTLQSAHNARMKTRVTNDLLENIELYPLVPAQQFTRPRVEAAFEQAFTTFRQKALGNSKDYSRGKTREKDNKARRSRRFSRKKIKLEKRISTRNQFPEFQSSLFDSAFKLECMSSEESDDNGQEETPQPTENNKQRNVILIIRYLAWRSSRLQRLFQVLDEKEEAERTQMPKRGIGRRVRRLGPPKAGDPPPPAGITRWMVSKKWLEGSRSKSGLYSSVIQTIVDNPEGLEVSREIASLGEESDDESMHEHRPIGHQSEQQHPVFQGTDAVVHSQWSSDYTHLYHSSSSLLQ